MPNVALAHVGFYGAQSNQLIPPRTVRATAILAHTLAAQSAQDYQHSKQIKLANLVSLLTPLALLSHLIPMNGLERREEGVNSPLRSTLTAHAA